MFSSLKLNFYICVSLLSCLSGRLGNGERRNKARGSWGEGKREQPFPSSPALPRFFNFPLFSLFSPHFLAVSPLKEPLQRREYLYVDTNCVHRPKTSKCLLRRLNHIKEGRTKDDPFLLLSIPRVEYPRGIRTHSCARPFAGLSVSRSMTAADPSPLV